MNEYAIGFDNNESGQMAARISPLLINKNQEKSVMNDKSQHEHAAVDHHVSEPHVNERHVSEPHVIESHHGQELTSDVPQKSLVPRRRWGSDEHYNVAHMKDSAGATESYDLTQLPEKVMTYLVFVGATALMTRSKSSSEEFQRMLDGTILSRKSPGAASGMNMWRQATAMALVELTRKTSHPISVEDSNIRAASFDNRKMRQCKFDPTVLHFYNILTGNIQESLLAD